MSPPLGSADRSKPAGFSTRAALGVVWLAAIVFGLALITGAYRLANPPSATQSTFAMDTVINVKAFGTGAGPAVQAALEEFRRVDGLLSAYDPASDIGKVNSLAGRSPARIAPETLSLLERSLQRSELTQGAFDVTIGPLVRLWGIGSEKERVPSRQEIDAARQLLGYRRVRLTGGSDPAAYLPLAGMGLDLGAVAKGYAAERAGVVLARHGIRRALIDAGGNIVALGNRPDGQPWQVGIRHPRREGAVIGVLAVRDAAVVTSGDYERFFVSDGRRYHHILDPATGYPAATVESVTVVAHSSTEADILSTALFVMGPERGRRLLAKLGADRVAGAIWVDFAGRALVTEGLWASFRPAAGVTAVEY